MVGYNVAIIPYLNSLSCVVLDGTCHQRTWRHTVQIGNDRYIVAIIPYLNSLSCVVLDGTC